MKLKTSDIEGHYNDSEGNLIAFDPSIFEKGPSCLLIEKKALKEFLEKQGLSIFWTIQGEKQMIGGSRYSNGWKGRLEIEGILRMDKGKIVGIIDSEYVDPHNIEVP